MSMIGRASLMHALGALSLLALLARSTAAQEVFGTLRRADTGLPAQGTLVVAERVSDGQNIARAVTGARGSFRLQVNSDRLVIRVLAIGYAPQVLDTVQLARGQQRELNAILTGTSVVLPGLRMASESRCRVKPDSASLVAKIFHEARTALAASQLIAPDGPVRTRVRVSEEIWATNENKMLESEYREYFSNSLRPFRTASVDSLLEHGFVTRRREPFGTHGVEVEVDYRVPSADVVVEDRFLESYCLYLAQTPADRPGLIGVGFRPSGNRRITQIEGTIWIDARTAELRRMEFGYAGLDANRARINPGGWLEFSRLETGLWFVSRWELRVPALGQWIQRSGRSTVSVMTRDVPAVRVSGEVLDLAVNSRTVYTVGAIDVVEEGALVPRPITIDSTQPGCPASQALAFGTVRSAAGHVLPSAKLGFFWRADGAAAEDWVRTEARMTSTGQYRVCGLPQDRLIVVNVSAEGHEPAAITLRVGAPRSAALLELVLAPTAGEADGLPR